MSSFNWKIKKKSKINNSRLGLISSPHGNIETPAFIFCATKGALKSFSTSDAKKKQYSNNIIKYLPFDASTRQ